MAVTGIDIEEYSKEVNEYTTHIFVQELVPHLAKMIKKYYRSEDEDYNEEDKVTEYRRTYFKVKKNNTVNQRRLELSDSKKSASEQSETEQSASEQSDSESKKADVKEKKKTNSTENENSDKVPKKRGRPKKKKD